MRKKWPTLGAIVAMVVLMAALPAIASADSQLPFSADVTGIEQVSPGAVEAEVDEGKVEIETSDESNALTLACGGDLVCTGLGLDGAEIVETHDSEVEVDLTTGEVSGEMEGTFVASTGLTGKTESTIAGVAIPGPLAGCPAGSPFKVIVANQGKWEANEIEAEGTFALAVEGCLGFPDTWSGSGVFSGTVEVEDGD